MAERILVVGGGGREHALMWNMLSHNPGRILFAAPGNGGTGQIGENVPIEATDIYNLANFADKNDINLTVVGPEQPLDKGIVDVFTERGLPIFGPTSAGATLETDKGFALKFMEKHHIPHPKFKIFTDISDAEDFIENPPWKEVVIKYPGLASGKGVIVPDTKEEAKDAIKKILGGSFGQTDRVIIQERLYGPEVSMLAFSDGKTIIPLLPAQDHKRLLDHDKGPNTGGMGAYAPVHFLHPNLLEEIQNTIFVPTIRGMERDGYPYKGILYAGLMMTDEGPKVLEYNVRFGDPETQALMMLLDSDLVPTMQSSMNGTLSENMVTFRNGYSVCFVCASEGYPGKYNSGQIILGLDKIRDPDVQVFHAGTIVKNGKIVTNGGRVLGVTAYAKNLSEAIAKAQKYIGWNGIHFRGMQHRTDIGATAS